MISIYYPQSWWVKSCLVSPVGVMITITCVIHSKSFLRIHSAVWVNQFRLVEWFWFVVSISILGSYNVSMEIFICFPACLIEKLSVILESRGKVRNSVTCFHVIIMLDFTNYGLGVGIWLCSLLGVEVCFPEGGAPLFVQTRMWLKPSLLAISTEEGRSSFIEARLVWLKPITKSVILWIHLPFRGPHLLRSLELLLLPETPTWYLAEGSTEFRVALGPRNEAAVFGDGVGLESLRRL